LQEIHLKKLKW